MGHDAHGLNHVPGRPAAAHVSAAAIGVGASQGAHRAGVLPGARGADRLAGAAGRRGARLVSRAPGAEQAAAGQALLKKVK